MRSPRLRRRCLPRLLRLRGSLHPRLLGQKPRLLGLRPRCLRLRLCGILASCAFVASEDLYGTPPSVGVGQSKLQGGSEVPVKATHTGTLRKDKANKYVVKATHGLWDFRSCMLGDHAKGKSAHSKEQQRRDCTFQLSRQFAFATVCLPEL